MRNMVTVLCQI